MLSMGPKAVGSGQRLQPTKSRSVLKEGDAVVAISLLNPGESGSVTFTAPEKAGAYPTLRAFTPATGCLDVRRDACGRRPCGRRTSGRRCRPRHSTGVERCQKRSQWRGRRIGVLFRFSGSRHGRAHVHARLGPGVEPGRGRHARHHHGRRRAGRTMATMPQSPMAPCNLHWPCGWGPSGPGTSWTAAGGHFAGNGDVMPPSRGCPVTSSGATTPRPPDLKIVPFWAIASSKVGVWLGVPCSWTMNADVVEEQSLPHWQTCGWRRGRRFRGWKQRRTMGIPTCGVEVVNLIEADPTLPRWYWSMDDTVRPTTSSRHKPERLPAAGRIPLVIYPGHQDRRDAFREKAWNVWGHRGRSTPSAPSICGAGNCNAGTTTVLSFDHRDADRYILAERRWF